METYNFCCQTCLRSADDQLSFFCPTCARNTLYEPRIQHAHVLLQKEAVGKDVENALRAGEERNIEGRPVEVSNSVAIEDTRAQQLEAVERTQLVLDHIEILRENVKQMKADIGKRKAQLSQRQAQLLSVNSELSQRQVVGVEPIEKSIKKTEYRWDVLHAKTVESRVFLCRETAKLYGLQQRRRRKGTSARETYLIGGVSIVDLRDLNNTAPSQITVSLLHIANLVHLTSHYLSLRLPAQIILPSPNNPQATIFSPLSSYVHHSTTHSASSKSSHSFYSHSPSTSEATTATRRPRPLYTDKPLPTLAKEDPIAYSLFIDGITFLAWDIAWMCKTQGLPVGSSSWEDVCSMGKNLYQLFIVPPVALSVRPSLSKGFSRDSSSKGATIAKSPGEPTLGVHEITAMSPTLGHLSHSTTHSYLPAAFGTEYMRGWKLSNPIRVIEKVKAALASERMGAEWELLDEGEWEEEAPTAAAPSLSGKDELKDTKDVRVGRLTGEHPALVKGTPLDPEVFEDTRGAMTATTFADDDLLSTINENINSEKGRGTNGWTKLKSRGGS